MGAFEGGEMGFRDVADVQPRAVLDQQVGDGTADAGGAGGHEDAEAGGEADAGHGGVSSRVQAFFSRKVITAKSTTAP